MLVRRRQLRLGLSVSHQLYVISHLHCQSVIFHLSTLLIFALLYENGLCGICGVPVLLESCQQMYCHMPWINCVLCYLEETFSFKIYSFVIFMFAFPHITCRYFDAQSSCIIGWLVVGWSGGCTVVKLIEFHLGQ